jgi:ATP-dependent DNA ligase
VAKPLSARALKPPIEPMLAKLAHTLPESGHLYEPKWDGFRAIVFRTMDQVYIQSRDLKPRIDIFPNCKTHWNRDCHRGA